MSSEGPSTRGWIDPNFPNPMGPNDAGIIIYGYASFPSFPSFSSPISADRTIANLILSYTPSFALCIAALVLFLLSLAVHSWEVFRHRAWYFLPLAFACLMEVIGYAFRTLSAKKNPYNVIYFVIQYFFIVTAPVFISASIYVCLSRLIDWSRSQGTNPHKRRWMRPKLILWVFITCDVVATILQIAGAAMIGVSQTKGKDPTTANNILLGGLGFQTAAFTIYFTLFILFTISLIRDPEFGSRLQGKAWFFLALFLASVLVYLRTCFRLAETAEGIFGNLSGHEVFFATLEFVPIVLAVWLLAIWHPGRYLPNVPERVRSSIDMEPVRSSKLAA